MAVFSDGGWRTTVRGKWEGGGPVKRHTGGRERERAGAGGRCPGTPHGQHGRPDKGKGALIGGPRATVPWFEFKPVKSIQTLLNLNFKLVQTLTDPKIWI
jgi:hypothetical protein